MFLLVASEQTSESSAALGKLFDVSDAGMGWAKRSGGQGWLGISWTRRFFMPPFFFGAGCCAISHALLHDFHPPPSLPLKAIGFWSRRHANGSLLPLFSCKLDPSTLFWPPSPPNFAVSGTFGPITRMINISDTAKDASGAHLSFINDTCSSALALAFPLCNLLCCTFTHWTTGIPRNATHFAWFDPLERAILLGDEEKSHLCKEDPNLISLIYGYMQHFKKWIGFALICISHGPHDQLAHPTLTTRIVRLNIGHLSTLRARQTNAPFSRTQTRQRLSQSKHWVLVTICTLVLLKSGNQNTRNGYGIWTASESWP